MFTMIIKSDTLIYYNSQQKFITRLYKMSFSSFLIKKFDSTHENNFFRTFSENLNQAFNNENGKHILLGNISCNGNQIDAIFITQRQISVIDFKDYQGRLTVSENNQWRIIAPTNETVFVQGGANNRNPFQQIKTYRYALMNFLSNQEDGIIHNNNINWSHIGAIVLFHRAIQLENDITSPKVKKWFHIQDIDNIITKLQNIISPEISLSDDEIQFLLETLNVTVDNLLETYIWNDEVPLQTRPISGSKIALLNRLLENRKDKNAIIYHYIILLNLERSTETRTLNLHSHPFRCDEIMNIATLQIGNQILQEGGYFIGLKSIVYNKTCILLYTNNIILKNHSPIPATLGNPQEANINSIEELSQVCLLLQNDIILRNQNLISFNLDNFQLYTNYLSGGNANSINELSQAINNVENIEAKLTCLEIFFDCQLNIPDKVEIKSVDDPQRVYEFSIKISQNYSINISNNDQFYNSFVQNQRGTFPKNIFIGVNILIGEQNYPLLHTIIPHSDLTQNAQVIEFDLNSFELHFNTMHRLQLGEDIIEELATAIKDASTFQNKLNCIENILGIDSIHPNSFSIGFTKETGFTTNLLSELQQISQLDFNDISNDIFKHYIQNEPLSDSTTALSLDPLIQITKLNQSQKEAVSMAFEKDLTIITGPPGTGKSQVVINLLANSIANDHSVIFVSKNNKAIDAVQSRFKEILDKPYDDYLLRFGAQREIRDNTIPILRRFLALGESNSLQNENEILQELNIDISNDITRVETLGKKINSIPILEDEVEGKQNDLQHLNSQRENWLNSINKEYKELFINNNFEIKIGISELGLLIQKINNWNKNYFSHLFFKVFYKKTFQRTIEQINKKQAEVIFNLLEYEAPWLVPDISILVSAKKNLTYLLELKKISYELNKKNSDICSKKKEIEENKQKINDLKSNQEQYQQEIEETKQGLLPKGIQALKYNINQRLLNLNADNLRNFINYIPGGGNNDAFIECAELLTNDFNAICLSSLSVKNSTPLTEGLFDLLIIDEASQCDIASAIPLIYRAKKVVVIGDPLQLKHITKIQDYEEQYILSELNLHNSNLNYVKESLFDYCNHIGNKKPSAIGRVFLKEHYRCHPEIINFPNMYIYPQGLNQTMEIKTFDDQYKIEEKGIYWININNSQMSENRNCNINERNECIRLTRHLVSRNPTAKIGIATPFRHQCEDIKRALDVEQNNQIQIDTIHGYQGDEKDIMILSLVVTNNSRASKARFINQNNYLINVAMTRAKGALYIIGNHEYCKSLPQETILAKLADYVERMNRVSYRDE